MCIRMQLGQKGSPDTYFILQMKFFFRFRVIGGFGGFGDSSSPVRKTNNPMKMYYNAEPCDSHVRQRYTI